MSSATTEGRFRISALSSRQSAISTHLLVLVGYLVLALVVTYPTILHFTTQIPGELIPDRNQDYWNLWWITRAVTHFSNPLHTDMLFYPYGVPLYYHILGITEWLIGLGPQLLWGYAAAYNTVVIMAFTLSGYGAFRLALFVTGRPLPSFLGGVVYAFTPYMLAAVSNWQYENTSIQFIPFFAEAWLRAWQPAVSAGTGVKTGTLLSSGLDLLRAGFRPLVVAGAVFALGMYTSLYYVVQFLIFLAVHIVYVLVTRRQWASDLIRTITSLLLMGVVALILTSPLVIGLAQNYKNPRLEVAAQGQMVEHSADLLSFVAFPHDHPLLGGTRYGVAKQDVRDNLTLGWVALALAILGGVVAWRNQGKQTSFWVAFALTAMVAAMGPKLQIGHTVTNIPLPFALLEGLPGLEAAGKLYRLVPLARCAMAVLAAWGAAWIFDSGHRIFAPGRQVTGYRRPKLRSQQLGILFAFVLSLLLFELPLHARYIEPFNVPPGFVQLGTMPPGGLMELPFSTQQSAVVADRMIYQTVHEHPIMSGYISRNYLSPTLDSCSPFWGFISPLDVPREGSEIAAPLVAERPADVLNYYNIRYLALYTRNGTAGAQVPADQMEAFRRIVSQESTGAPFYSDDFVSIYSVRSQDISNSPASFHIGSGWYGVEKGGAQPFRWMKEGRATLCVFAPRAIAASLTMEGTAFATSRHITVRAANSTLYEGVLPTGGGFAPIKTGPVNWQPGVTEVSIEVQEPGTTPDSLDPSANDDRPLTAGFRAVRMLSEGPK